jgi:DNA-nicking Smr family endonuclease
MATGAPSPGKSSRLCETSTMVARRRRLSAEEQDLWRHVAASVSPLQRRPLATLAGGSALAGSQASPLAVDPAPAAKPDFRRVSVEPLPLAGNPSAATLPPGLDKRTVQRLRRGKLPVEGRLDLHGMTQAQAHGALQRFISASRAMNRRTVLVITGKGWDPMAKRPEEAMGVLRRAVPRWLTTPPLSLHVAGVSDAHIKDGGTGALYVLLRRTRRIKP